MNEQKKSGRINARTLSTLTRQTLHYTITHALDSYPAEHRNQIPQLISSILAIFTQELHQHHCIRLIRIGCLVVSEKLARSGGRHFATGKSVKVPARTVVTLRQRKGEQRVEFGSNDMLARLKTEHPLLPLEFLRIVFRTFLHQIEKIRHGHTRIEIRGFGTFYPSYRAAKTVRDPRTGEKMHKEAYVAILFRCSSTLQKALSAPPVPRSKAA